MANSQEKVGRVEAKLRNTYAGRKEFSGYLKEYKSVSNLLKAIRRSRMAGGYKVGFGGNRKG